MIKKIKVSDEFIEVDDIEEFIEKVFVECVYDMACTLKNASIEEQIKLLKAKPGWVDEVAEEQLHVSVKFMLL